MNFKRKLDLSNLLKNKSFFLFGPRSTGKTYLINQQLKTDAIVLDMLRSDLYMRFLNNPSELEDVIAADGQGRSLIVIDEVQKVPEILNEVHRLIEKRKDLRFLLTGSSSRKLKRNDADMLAGRAWRAELFPLSWSEIPEFDLELYLRYGGLPQVYQSTNPEEELYSYVETYLREEIRAEGLVRKMPPFSRFLKTAALSNGNMINFTEIGSDAAVSPSTVREYYSILEDTLVGFLLEPWLGSKKRKAIATAKFYFFDTGVTHTLAGTKVLDRNSDLYGRSFEQFIAMELRAYLSYKRIRESLTFWRTTHGSEVDFLIGDSVAVEVKSTKSVSDRHMLGLSNLAEEKIFKKYFLVTQDKIAKKSGDVLCIHWTEFLEMLWQDNIIISPQG